MQLWRPQYPVVGKQLHGRIAKTANVSLATSGIPGMSNSAANIWLNCAFNDTSMTFGTLLEYTFLVIFGYMTIADLTCDKTGSHFPIWPPS